MVLLPDEAAHVAPRLEKRAWELAARATRKTRGARRMFAVKMCCDLSFEEESVGPAQGERVNERQAGC
jgi:hypothetical protein